MESKRHAPIFPLETVEILSVKRVYGSFSAKWGAEPIKKGFGLIIRESIMVNFGIKFHFIPKLRGHVLTPKFGKPEEGWQARSVKELCGHSVNGHSVKSRCDQFR